MTFTFRDFGEAWSVDMPPVVFFVGHDLMYQPMYQPDQDGLICTLVVNTGSNEWLLTILFPMTMPQAQTMCRKKNRFPLVPGQSFTVLDRVGSVTGNSGEVYSRFLVEVGNTFIPRNFDDL